MQEQKDYRLRFHRLLGYMSDVGYARGSIACVEKAIEEMACWSESPSSSDYEKAICKAIGYNRRRAMRIVRDFDIEGTLPVVNYKRPLKEAVYALLPLSSRVCVSPTRR